MSVERESILEHFASEAVRLGADEIEVEYKDGHEHIFATKNGVGFGIGRLLSSAPEAITLRDELQSITRHKRAIVIDRLKVELRATAFESFGETVFLVKVRRVQTNALDALELGR
jgi:hypothetical protein